MLLMLLPLLCLAGTGAVHAQKWQLKVGGGLASQGVHNRVVGAYKIGVAYEYEFDQRWTFSPGLMFYGKGWRTPDESVACVDDDGNPMLNESGQQVYSLMSRSASANYVEVPLLFNYYYRLAESRYVVLSAGPYVSFGVAGKIKTKGDGSRIGSEKLFYEGNTFSLPGARRIDAGVQAHLGYQMPSGLTIGVEGDFGLVPFNRGGHCNLVGLVSLGYSF